MLLLRRDWQNSPKSTLLLVLRLVSNHYYCLPLPNKVKFHLLTSVFFDLKRGKNFLTLLLNSTIKLFTKATLNTMFSAVVRQFPRVIRSRVTSRMLNGTTKNVKSSLSLFNLRQQTPRLNEKDIQKRFFSRSKVIMTQQFRKTFFKFVIRNIIVDLFYSRLIINIQ